MRGETFYRRQRKNGGGGQYFLRCAQIDILGLVEGAVFSVNACVISEGVVKFNYISNLEKSKAVQKKSCKILQWLNYIVMTHSRDNCSLLSLHPSWELSWEDMISPNVAGTVLQSVFRVLSNLSGPPKAPGQEE